MRKTAGSITILLFALFLSIGFPQAVKAKQELTIPEWVTYASLYETGDLHIEEDITFKFTDKFNGVFREIMLERTSGVTDIKVHEIIGPGLKSYDQVSAAKNGDSGVFLVKKDSDRIIIQIFSPSKDQEKTFKVNYTVKNVAIKYNDIGELYYKFLGDENETEIRSFRVFIKLPAYAANNTVNVFAHGPLNGKIFKENDTIWSLYVENVPTRTFIEGRVVFPKEFISLSNNIRNIDNYNNIIAEETAYKNELEEDRKRREESRKLFEQITILASVFGLVVFLAFLVKLRRVSQVDEIYEGYKSGESTGIPEDCTPAVAALLTGTVFGTDTVFATILDLVRKGYFAINSMEDKFIITQEKEEDSALLEHEKFFIEWLIGKIGDGRSVDIHQIEKYSENNRSKFTSMYTNWINKIRRDAVNKGYYDKSKTKSGAFFLIYSLILMILSILTLTYDSPYGLAGLIISVVVFIYSITLFTRKSDYGYLRCKQWFEFRKYMKQYNTDNADFTKDSIDRYSEDVSLIYALGLGLKKETDESEYEEDWNVNGVYYDNRVNKGKYFSNNWILWYMLYTSSNKNDFQKSINKSFSGTGNSSYNGGYSGGGFTGGGGGGAGGGGAGGF